MTNEEIEKLRGFCEDFKKFRDNTVDGKGNNLHDIKVSFDYVKKTLETNKLTGTVFGENLITKATAAGDVLSKLWLCLQDLETSVNGFCDQQEANNRKS